MMVEVCQVMKFCGRNKPPQVECFRTIRAKCSVALRTTVAHVFIRGDQLWERCHFNGANAPQQYMTLNVYALLT